MSYFEDNSAVEIDGKTYLSKPLLRAVLAFASTDLTRHHLSAVWTEDGSLYATDGHAMIKLPVRDGTSKDRIGYCASWLRKETSASSVKMVALGGTPGKPEMQRVDPAIPAAPFKVQAVYYGPDMSDERPPKWEGVIPVDRIMTGGVATSWNPRIVAKLAPLAIALDVVCVRQIPAQTAMDPTVYEFDQPGLLVVKVIVMPVRNDK